MCFYFPLSTINPSFKSIKYISLHFNLFYIHPINKMVESESHVIRVTCFIQKLKLNIRFPCTISFQMKNCNPSFIAEQRLS